MTSIESSTFGAVRAKFPGTKKCIYLNVAGRGLLSSDVYQAITTHMDELRDGSVDKSNYFKTVARVRAQFAELINADPIEVAFTKNVSDGLNVIASAFKWRPSDNVVLCTDLEHPNNVYPWLNIRDRCGIEVRTVPHQHGDIDVGRMIDAIDANTRLVTASTVTFSPGLRTDIETLGRACRERNVFFLVDAAQSVGVMHTDVKKMQVDGLAVATQKALLGLYGMGFLYCRAEWAEKLRPAALARFSVNLGEDMHEASTGSAASYQLMPAAQRFDLGNYNYPAIHAVTTSLDLLLSLGHRLIDQYVTGLAAYFTEGLIELGVPVCSAIQGPKLSHTVSAGTYSQDANETTGDRATASLAKYLQDNNVIYSVRRGLMRFALHIYNNREDIDAVLRLIRRWRSENETLTWVK